MDVGENFCVIFICFPRFFGRTPEISLGTGHMAIQLGCLNNNDNILIRERAETHAVCMIVSCNESKEKEKGKPSSTC